MWQQEKKIFRSISSSFNSNRNSKLTAYTPNVNAEAVAVVAIVVVLVVAAGLVVPATVTTEVVGA